MVLSSVNTRDKYNNLEINIIIMKFAGHDIHISEFTSDLSLKDENLWFIILIDINLI